MSGINENENENGSAILVVALTLIVLLLIGTVGWSIYKGHHHKAASPKVVVTSTHKTTTSTTKSTQSTTSSPTTSTSEPASSVPISSTSYITISQWSVQFPEPSIPGLVYEYGDIGLSNDQTGANFDAAICSTGNGVDGTLGSLSRSTTPSSEGMASDNTSGQVAQIDGYYYTYTYPEYNCGGTQQQESQVGQDWIAIMTALKSLSSVN